MTEIQLNITSQMKKLKDEEKPNISFKLTVRNQGSWVVRPFPNIYVFVIDQNTVKCYRNNT